VLQQGLQQGLQGLANLQGLQNLSGQALQVLVLLYIIFITPHVESFAGLCIKYSAFLNVPKCCYFSPW
jgi:hypothetical protein